MRRTLNLVFHTLEYLKKDYSDVDWRAEYEDFTFPDGQTELVEYFSVYATENESGKRIRLSISEVSA